MEYSLLNRFRGAWLGSIIGQQLKSHRQDVSATLRSPVASLEKAIETDLERQIALWKAAIQRSPIDLLEFGLTPQSQTSEIALFILPLTLYYHDDWSYLSGFLAKQSNSLQQSEQEIENILVWCYAIGLALRGQLTCHSLINRVVVGTRLEEKQSIQWLKTVTMSCLKGWNAAQLLESLSGMEQQEIPLSLFCFLNNPEDFCLTTQQALHEETNTTHITALSGVLSGAYNGITAIPLNWRNLLQNKKPYQQINQTTQYAIAKWMGMNSRPNSQALDYSVITAPKILQPRSNLKIISQQEY